MPNYVIKIFKSWGARASDRRWSNTYEARSDAASPSGMLDFATALVEAERNLHLPGVNFLSATVSTWEEEQVTYDPFSFSTLELSGVGTRLGGQDNTGFALDTNVCLMVKFSPATGRSGKRFYRGVLLESDVRMGGDGFATFDPAGPFMSNGADSGWPLFFSSITPLLSPGSDDGELVMIGPAVDGPAQRALISVSRGSIVVNKRNHRYFDIT